MSSTATDDVNPDTDQGKETSNHRPQPSLLDSLLVTPDQDATNVGFGVLCNDPSGQCLSATGAFIYNKPDDKNNNNNLLKNMDDVVTSGVYTSLTKLAQQLRPGITTETVAVAAPLITIETEDLNLLVKEYDGHTIALKVPAADAAGGAGADGSAITSGQGAASPGGPTN